MEMLSDFEKAVSLMGIIVLFITIVVFKLKIGHKKNKTFNLHKS